MGCCGSSMKKEENHNEDDQNMMSYEKNDLTKDKVFKFSSTFLHLVILAILVLGNKIAYIQDNLRYIIFGYVLLFILITIYRAKSRAY